MAIWSLLQPPRLLRSRSRAYLAYRPDAEFVHGMHPELAELGERWIRHNPKNRGDLPRLYALAFNIKQVLAENVPGDFAELGVFRGNSAAVLAHYARQHGRQVYLFDTFGGFDPRDLVDIDSDKGQDFTVTSVDTVRDVVGDSAVVYLKGWFPGTIPDEVDEPRYAVVHLDCDLYEPMIAGLQFFYPRLSPGGLLIVHDYGGAYWNGVQRALDRFVAGIHENLIQIPDKSGTAMIRKSS